LDPRHLVELVVCDRKIHELQLMLRGGRRREAELEKELTETRGQAGEAQRKLEEVAAEIRKYEREIEDYRRQTKTHSSRLNEISDSREYRALNDEIRYLLRQVQEREEAILALLEAQEKQSAEFETSKGSLAAKTAAIAAEKERIDQERAQQTEQLTVEQAARNELLKTLPESASSYYVRRSKRIEMPLVWLREGACGFCLHKLPPQKAIEVRDGRTLVECESCGRVIVNVETHANGAESSAKTP
jgi:predicted  nucleic acid-binding Zn-ribbon protein